MFTKKIKLKQKRKMKNRLFSNYVTTILGLLIIVFCAIMMYTEKATTNEISGWFAFGVMCLRSKDSLIGLPKE